jgi:hypothetical protein
VLDRDRQALEAKGLRARESSESGFLCVIIEGYPLPPGYDRTSTDLLIRLPAGYPDAAPDMFWCDPPIKLTATGAFPVAADQMEPYVGRVWQRFSRHLAADAWKAGTDDLASYLSLVSRALRASVG